MTRAEAIERAPDGWMHPSELGWLYDNAAASPVVLEIGVWRGRSTSVLCAACPGVVLAIDHFRGGRDDEPASPQVARDERIRDAARANLAPYLDAGKLLLMEESSEMAFGALALLHREPFVDMLFIDGDHRSDAVMRDLRYEAFVKPGGLVAGHDYDHKSVACVVEPREPHVCERIWWWRKWA